MYCSECGDRLLEAARFCPKCGAAVPAGASAGDTAPGAVGSSGPHGDARTARAGAIIPANTMPVTGAHAFGGATRAAVRGGSGSYPDGHVLPANTSSSIGRSGSSAAGARSTAALGALVAIGSMFLPWVSCGNVPLTGVDLAGRGTARQVGMQLSGQSTGLLWLIPVAAGLILLLVLLGVGRSPRENAGLCGAAATMSAIGAVVSVLVIAGILYQKMAIGQSLFGRLAAQAITLQIGGFVALGGFGLSYLGSALEQALQDHEDD